MKMENNQVKSFTTVKIQKKLKLLKSMVGRLIKFIECQKSILTSNIRK